MKLDVIIVGSGLVGGSLALALLKRGFRVALVDKSDLIVTAPQHYDTPVYALRSSSVEFLISCDVWKNVDLERVVNIQNMDVFGDDLKSKVSFDAYRLAVEKLGVTIEDANLRGAVNRELISSVGLHLFTKSRASTIRQLQDRVILELSSGDVLEAELVVGADGPSSRLRQIADIKFAQKNYNEEAVVTNFRVEKVFRNTAMQWFRNNGILALLPMPENIVSMVWSIPTKSLPNDAKLLPENLTRAVQQATDCQLGHLTQISKIKTYPLKSLRTEKIVSDRLVLIGDAAHQVHPLAGQGLNLGLADAGVLASILGDCGGPNRVGNQSTLATYRRSRSEELLAMSLTIDGLRQLFSSKVFGVAKMRNFGLRCVDGNLWIKRFLVHRATKEPVLF